MEEVEIKKKGRPKKAVEPISSNVNLDKHGYRDESLCIKCHNVFGSKCPWETEGEPVPGWEAEDTIIKSFWGDTPTFLVRECPLFEPDVPTYEGLTPLTAKGLAIAVVGAAYKDVVNTFHAINRLKKLPNNAETRETMKELLIQLGQYITPFYNGTLEPWIDLFELTWYSEKFTNNIKKKCEELKIDFNVDQFIAQIKPI